MHVGDSVVCTITNTRSTGTVKVNKHWVGGATGETPGVDLNISGPSSSTTHVTGLADGSTGAKPVVTGTYHVSESGLPTGWTENNTITCQNGTQPSFPYTGDGFAVHLGDSVVCTITNTRDTGQVTVVKHWVGGADGETPSVTLHIAGPSSSDKSVSGLDDGQLGPKPVVTGRITCRSRVCRLGGPRTTRSPVRTRPRIRSPMTRSPGSRSPRVTVWCARSPTLVTRSGDGDQALGWWRDG